jgi:hypothetical protein
VGRTSVRVFPKETLSHKNVSKVAMTMVPRLKRQSLGSKVQRSKVQRLDNS